MVDYTFGLGEELQFNAPDTGLTHSWNFGDGTTSTESSPAHIYTAEGIYTITHSAGDFCGSCLAVSHTVEIIPASITVRSVLLDKYTADVGDTITITVIAQNLGPVYGTGTIVTKIDGNVINTSNVTLDSGQEISFTIQQQITKSGTVNICADDICTVLFVESNISVKSVTLDRNTSTGEPIIATIEVENKGISTESKLIKTTLTNTVTVVIDERIVTISPGNVQIYDVPISVTDLPNGTYNICAESICKPISVSKPVDATGNVNITSVPNGADIYIDGELKDVYTDTTISGLSPGTHTFTLKLTGYNNTTGSFAIVAGTTTYIYITLSPLEPATGSISITSIPIGASIWIDGEQQFDIHDQPLVTPKTITGLSPGNHNITLKLSGYNDYNTILNVISSQTIYFSAVLVQAPILIGSINFTTVPDGASIWIDGIERIGKFTPITIDNIPIGSHTFVLKYPGRNNATGNVIVVGGAISHVYVEMSLISTDTGSLSISSIPQIADIYLNGALRTEKTPTTIDNLTPRTYTILIKKAGYNDYTITVDTIAGQTLSISTTLVPITVMAGVAFPWWLMLGIAVGGIYTIIKTRTEVKSQK